MIENFPENSGYEIRYVAIDLKTSEKQSSAEKKALLSILSVIKLNVFWKTPAELPDLEVKYSITMALENDNKKRTKYYDIYLVRFTFSFFFCF